MSLAESTVSPVLSVVSPVYGCADCLAELCRRITTAVEGMGLSFEIVLVCDASPDASWERMRELAAADPRVKGLRFTRNFGQHVAISAGLQHASGEWIVVLDCDLQDQPESIPALYGKAQEGHDVVMAARKDRQDSWFKRMSSKAFHGVLGYLTGQPQNPETANFGIYHRRVIAELNAMPESGRFFPLMVRWSGFPVHTVDVEHASRASGRSAYTLRRMIALALDIIISYSDRPLRLVAKLGLWFGLASVLFAGISVYRYMIGDIAVAGFTSIIASIWLVGGAMIASIGIVGLYVGRIFNETKRRPHYIIDAHLRSSSTSSSSVAPRCCPESKE